MAAPANLPPHIAFYEDWARLVKATLVKTGLWDVVENGIPPDPSKNPELSASDQAEELSKYRAMVVKDMKVLQILLHGLPDSHLRELLSAASAKDVWDVLELGNEQSKLHRRLDKKFEELSMEEGETLDLYLDRVLEIVQQFRRPLKKPKSDYEVITKVLDSVSGSYGDVGSLLEQAVDLKNMSLSKFVKFCYGFESITEEAIVLKLRDLSIESESENDGNQEGCDSVAQMLENLRSESESIEEIKADYLRLAAVTKGDSTYDEDMWMVSGHAAEHMTRYEKFFTTLDRTFKVKLGLKDGTFMKVEGKGDVKIIMKEGKTETIENVFFVPRGINKNVLSFSQMTEKGCSFLEGERGECIVRDRSGAVFGETIEYGKEIALRLRVIEGNLTSESENNHNQEECESIYREGARPRTNECLLCREQGHYARDCKWKNPQQAAKEAKEAEEEETKAHYLQLIAVTKDESTYDEDMWLVSRHAANHMTRYEKLFTTLDRTFKARLGLVDGTCLMIEGKGNVKITMNERKKKTISNVLFVPRGINKNVLSVSQMESRGYLFSVEGGKRIIRDRTGAEFGETMCNMKEPALRLEVIEGNLTS